MSGKDKDEMYIGLEIGLWMNEFIDGVIMMGILWYMYVRRSRKRIKGSNN
jgi:preprotein translocase subunit YajC